MSVVTLSGCGLVIGRTRLLREERLVITLFWRAGVDRLAFHRDIDPDTTARNGFSWALFLGPRSSRPTLRGPALVSVFGPQVRWEIQPENYPSHVVTSHEVAQHRVLILTWRRFRLRLAHELHGKSGLYAIDLPGISLCMEIYLYAECLE